MKRKHGIAVNLSRIPSKDIALSICLIAAVIFPSNYAFTQRKKDGVPPKGLQFEVASIRESLEPRAYNRDLLGFGNLSIRGTLFSVNDLLISYIRFAYNTFDVNAISQISGSLPANLRSKKYRIDARTAVPDPTRDDLQQMVRSLLEERFRLKVSLKTEQGPVYYLSLARPGVLGPGLKPHPAEEPCFKAGQHKDATTTSAPCGVRTSIESHAFRVTITGMTMEEFAPLFPAIMNGALPDMELLPGRDRTSLKGLYDSDLSYVPRMPAASKSQADEGGDDLIAALKETAWNEA